MSNDLGKSELGQALQDADPGFVRKLNKLQREQLANALFSVQKSYSVSIQHETHHSGPLPSPDTLQQYNEVIPNGAERIMVMAEAQSEHRKSLEAKVIESQTRQSERGQIIAGILAFVLIGAGVAAFLTGHDGVAGTIFGVTVVGLVTVFVLGKSDQQKNLAIKQQANR